MNRKIVAFGEVVWDVLPNGKVLGGTPLNMAFRSNCFQEKGYLLSRVGEDDLGLEAIKQLQDLNIADENVQLDYEFPTGTVKVTFDEFNEPQFNVKLDVAFDHIEFSAEALKLARNADCLFFGLLPQRFGISKNTIRELIKESPDSIHFFDLKLFQHFFDAKQVENLLRISNIVRIKEKEVNFLGDKLAIQANNLEEFGKLMVTKYKVDIILVTRGENGVFAYHKTLGAFNDAGYELKMQDNIGSGMAFSAGFLHYYLNKESIQEAINFGNAAGALNATRRGATSFFNKNDVLQFMQSSKKRK